MRIALIWNFGQAREIFPNWRDGHRAALEEVAKKHHIDWYFGDDYKKIKNGEHDFLMFWTDATDPVVHHFDDNDAKKGIIITSDNNFPGNLKKFDVVYCESEPVLKQVESFGVRAILGMGTDTDFYAPDDSVEKDIEYFYPATFSPWKKQSEIAHFGKKLLCVGTKQPDGEAEYLACVQKGVRIELGYFQAQKIRDYYLRTQKIVIPAVHGSERTVLEVMSMNIIPEVTNGHINVRTASYGKEYEKEKKENKDLTPRDFILKYYSHVQYGKALLEGIET